MYFKYGAVKKNELGEFFGDPISSLRLRIEKNGKNNGKCPSQEIDRLRIDFQTKPNSAEIDQDFTSRKFGKSTNRVNYGVEYDVHFIPILSNNISVEDCVNFMKEKEYSLFGPILLPFIKGRKEVPREMWVTSLDVEKNLHEREGNKVLPCMKLEEDGYFQIQLAICFAGLNKNNVLACARPRS